MKAAKTKTTIFLFLRSLLESSIHLRYVLYPMTIINNRNLAGLSSLIKDVSKNHVPSVGNTTGTWKASLPSVASCQHWYVTRALLGVPHTECFTGIFEMFAVEQRVRLHNSWKVCVTGKKNVAQSSVKKRPVLNNRKYRIAGKYSSDRFGAGQEEHMQTHFPTEVRCWSPQLKGQQNF